MFSFPILIGDIGGTNSRFAIIEKQDADMIQFPSVKNAGYASIQDVIEQNVFSQTDLRPKTLVLAIAGPTGNIEKISMTNCPWDIDVYQLIDALDIDEAIAMSDFEAQALAAISTDVSSHALIKEGKSRPTSARAVLGPGTGLGMAGMIFIDGEWSIIPGEGGFVDIGPKTPRDTEIYKHAFAPDERPAAEEFISGRGLMRLYNAISKADGLGKSVSDPSEVTAAYSAGNDPIAKETLELFVSYLGRYASDAALIYLARGGVYLTGGVAQRLEDVLKLPFFTEQFLDKEPYSDLVEEVPVYLMTEPLIALSGLCAYANHPDQFRITKQGRYWQNQK